MNITRLPTHARLMPDSVDLPLPDSRPPPLGVGRVTSTEGRTLESDTRLAEETKPTLALTLPEVAPGRPAGRSTWARGGMIPSVRTDGVAGPVRVATVGQRLQQPTLWASNRSEPFRSVARIVQRRFATGEASREIINESGQRRSDA